MEGPLDFVRNEQGKNNRNYIGLLYLSLQFLTNLNRIKCKTLTNFSQNTNIKIQDSRLFLLKCVGITSTSSFVLQIHSSCATWAYYTLQLFDIILVRLRTILGKEKKIYIHKYKVHKQIAIEKVSDCDCGKEGRVKITITRDPRFYFRHPLLNQSESTN